MQFCNDFSQDFKLQEWEINKLHCKIGRFRMYRSGVRNFSQNTGIGYGAKRNEKSFFISYLFFHT